MARCTLPILALLVLGSLAPADAATPDTGACDATAFATTLHAAPDSPTLAEAYWLDRRLLQWPGQAAARPGERFRLHHSQPGTITVPEGPGVEGADGAIDLQAFGGQLPPAVAERFRFIDEGVVLALPGVEVVRLPALLRGQLVLTREDADGRVLAATTLQHPGALDDLYAAAFRLDDLGATPTEDSTRFRLWAPTAREVFVCLHDAGDTPATDRIPLQRDDTTGAWSTEVPGDLSGNYYTYLVDVFVPGTGLVRNRVTDPYSVSLSTDSARSYVADLDDPELKPKGWDGAPRPAPLASQTDMVIYELHVRDFSRDDATVGLANRGKYLAFTEADSDGMRHLRALAEAGLTDVHLLPVFDLATVPEEDCLQPAIPDAAPDSPAQQAAVMAVADRDCFNWGYDPFHFNAPEGSFASDAAEGAVRIRELRAMVQALHAAGLRVGMDVVYNHTTASGQDPRSVLDRIVPGYYHRLDGRGAVTTSTCCDNTATEHLMMGKLMLDSAGLWARHYRIDSFRFDLMGHQPRAVMEQLQQRVNEAAGRHVNLIGEGWNFGEVANGARFVQASQDSLQHSGIATFSDRARDAIRGGSAGDSGEALHTQGYVNGLHYDPNGHHDATREELLHAADLVRAGLAGTLADYRMTDYTGADIPLSALDYKGMPAGYAAEPGEVVNYVENHDNQTLFDVSALRLPPDTSPMDRARVQVLALALNAFSQGVAYFHAGGELMRSKSLDRNSYDSGDWFNRIDWTGSGNHFGIGLPPATDNEASWPQMAPLLGDPGIKPGPEEIAFVRESYLDLLRIRASTTLFRMRTAEDVKQRLRLHNTGPDQNPLVIVGELDGRGYPGATFKSVLYLVNVSPEAQEVRVETPPGRSWRLHPALRGKDRPAPYHDGGRFRVPGRTAVVYVADQHPAGLDGPS
ncbi:pullulanase-type alpha-1,6-glucosidase [Novilysobacter defluvii]|uniref:Alpha-1,6-glucosidase n=1 Tax=Lysobacter defluvii IMMIB APB-9 = DSM 18482 TaxID=1385515 RepID=A0A0A0M985_9GAMM|nr:pullulanase-type alpha-1,6-glucosidase [Lysobacter defluvii]KGO98527.1 alpha-1,6-glucosidase [Lysobacter defluvii IMMIB APB-9 = DSM 18482]